MPDDDLILERTPLGQRAVFDEIALASIELRLLRLVNGYTPLGDLAARLDATHDWHAVAFDLLDQGYVAESPESARDLSTPAVDNPVEEA
jgi:hypothetical protein